jgi:hypothetical protein
MAKDDNVIDLFGDEKDVIEELFDTSGALLVLSMSDEGEMSLSSNVEVDTMVMMLEAAKMSLLEDVKVH